LTFHPGTLCISAIKINGFLIAWFVRDEKGDLPAYIHNIFE
jgi:hypothetical protein